MMRQLKGEALYIVASPSEGSWLFRFKDDEFNFCDDCRVTIASGGNVDTAIGKELIADAYTRPEGAEAVQYTAIPHYTGGQTKELAKRFDYAVDALHDKRVLVVGAGTIGNLMLESLVLSGVGRITIDGVPYELHEGESIVMPARHPHAVYGQEQFKMLLVVVF